MPATFKNVIEEEIQRLIPSIVDLRHELHAWPEIGYQEFRTSEKVIQHLRELPGIQIQSGMAETGIVAVINGDSDGPCIALRADMDCLPMEDHSGKPWRSKRPGLAHTCGHDGHTAALVGAAKILEKHRNLLQGPVKLIFQPAEEGGAGGKAMIKAGALENPKVESIYGLHGFPGLKVSEYGIRKGPIMAASDILQFRIIGRGAHAAMPHLGRDPILASAHVITALQSLASRRTDPLDSSVVTIGKISGGSAFNIIPDEVDLLGTLRTLHDNTRTRIHEEAENLINSVSQAFGCRAEIKSQWGYPVCVNASDAVDYFEMVFADTLKPYASLKYPDPIMGGEDFAFYGESVSSAFFFVGVRPEGETDPAQLHQSHYDFNDQSLPHAIRAFAALALHYGDR